MHDKQRQTNQRTHNQNNGEAHCKHIGFGCCFGWLPDAISRSDAAVDVEVVPDKKALSSIVQYLDDLGATVDGRALMSERDRDAKDISQALLATHLKSVKDLSHIAKGALQAQFPGSAGASTSRSAGFLSSTQFRIDMAYMLLTRDIGFKNCLLKWAWADSSPQGGHDFMLWKYKYIFAQMLLPVAMALVLLVTTPMCCSPPSRSRCRG